MDPASVADINGARVLVLLGDSVTTDHISPAGGIAADGPAAAYLQEQGVKPADFNSYGSRRGNHEVMMRGTFANIRLRNRLAPGTEGGWTKHQPSGEQMVPERSDYQQRADGRGCTTIVKARDDDARVAICDVGRRLAQQSGYDHRERCDLVGCRVLLP